MDLANFDSRRYKLRTELELEILKIYVIDVTRKTQTVLCVLPACALFLLTVRPSHEELIWLRSTHCTLYCPQPGQASDWSPRVSTGRSLVNFGADHKLECECILFSPSFSLMRRSNGMSTSMVQCVQSLD